MAKRQEIDFGVVIESGGRRRRVDYVTDQRAKAVTMAEVQAADQSQDARVVGVLILVVGRCDRCNVAIFADEPFDEIDAETVRCFGC